MKSLFIGLSPKSISFTSISVYNFDNRLSVPSVFNTFNFAFVSLCPQALFGLQSLHILGLSDNELTVLPSAVSNLSNLREVDISKNGELQTRVCFWVSLGKVNTSNTHK